MDPILFDEFEDELMENHASDDHVSLWTDQEEETWKKCHEVVSNTERKRAMTFMKQVEKLFGDASLWVEALQLIDISGGIVDDTLFLRAAVAVLVVYKLRATGQTDEASVHGMLAVANLMSARAITMDDVFEEEMSLLTTMEFEIDLPTPLTWFNMFLVRFDSLTRHLYRATIETMRVEGHRCIETCVSTAPLSARFGPKKMAAGLLGLLLSGASFLPPRIWQPGVMGSPCWMRAVEGVRQRCQPLDETRDFLDECLHTTQLEELELRDSAFMLMKHFGNEVVAALST
jgi:hypothetical protein